MLCVVAINLGLRYNPRMTSQLKETTVSRMDECRKGQYTVYFKDEESYLGRFEVGPFESSSIDQAISEAKDTANEMLDEGMTEFGQADVATVWFYDEGHGGAVKVYDHQVAR